MSEAIKEAKSLTGPTAHQPKKVNRHVAFALNHMTNRRDDLNGRIAAMTAERDALDVAIKAVE
jgi:hypothetical protein